MTKTMVSVEQTLQDLELWASGLTLEVDKASPRILATMEGAVQPVANGSRGAIAMRCLRDVKIRASQIVLAIDRVEAAILDAESLARDAVQQPRVQVGSF